MVFVVMVFKITVFTLGYAIDSYSNSNAPKLLTCIAPNKCAIASFMYLGSSRFACEFGVLVVLGGWPTGHCGVLSHSMSQPRVDAARLDVMEHNYTIVTP